MMYYIACMQKVPNVPNSDHMLPATHTLSDQWPHKTTPDCCLFETESEQADKVI